MRTKQHYSLLTGNWTQQRTNVAAFDVLSADARPWDPEAGGSVVTALAGAANGDVAIAGDFVAAGGTPRNHLAAFDLATGELTPFDPNVDRQVRALAIRGEQLYAAGEFWTVNGGTPRNLMAAFDLATGTATAFDPYPTSTVTALAVSDEAVYAAGFFQTVNGDVPRDRIASFDPNTGAARDFRPTSSSLVNALGVRDGTVFMGGTFWSMNGEGRPYLAAVQDIPGTAGALTAFDPRPSASVSSLVVDGDRVYASGQFGQVGTPPQPASRIAAFDAQTGTVVPWDAGIRGFAFELVKAGDQIVAGGSISAANGQPRTKLAAFATGAGGLVDWAPAPDDNVDAMAWSATTGGLVVGGRFSRIGSTLTGPLTVFAFTPPAPTTPPVPVTPGTPRANAADATPPVLTDLRITNRRFRLGRRDTPRIATAKRGTTFGFTLSEPATTAIAIARVMAGRRDGSRCVKPRPQLKRRCTRYKPVHTLRRTTAAGRNRVAYTGRVKRTKLAPGRYRATLIATDAAGNRSIPIHAGFRVVSD